MRSISRVADVSINTVSKLLVEAGEACLAIHDETVRNVKVSRIQCDEIWSFCHPKEQNVLAAKAVPEGAGDVWTWTAIDADTKLIVSYFVGDRGGESAMILMDLTNPCTSSPKRTRLWVCLPMQKPSTGYRKERSFICVYPGSAITPCPSR